MGYYRLQYMSLHFYKLLGLQICTRSRRWTSFARWLWKLTIGPKWRLSVLSFRFLKPRPPFWIKYKMQWLFFVPHTRSQSPTSINWLPPPRSSPHFSFLASPTFHRYPTLKLPCSILTQMTCLLHTSWKPIFAKCWKRLGSPWVSQWGMMLRLHEKHKWSSQYSSAWERPTPRVQTQMSLLLDLHFMSGWVTSQGETSLG